MRFHTINGRETQEAAPSLDMGGAPAQHEPGALQPEAHPHKGRVAATLERARAWGRLPNSIAIDPRVSVENLLLLALRTTLIDYALAIEGHNVLVRGGGLGRNVVKRANAEAVRLGLLIRDQAGGQPGSKFAYAKERLTLPEPGKLGRRIVPRQWFDGTLDKQELAVLLYLRAAGRVMCREVAARFGWSRPTAKGALDRLAHRGLVVVLPTRTATGAFAATFYKAIPSVPRDLRAAHPAMVNFGGPENYQPGKSHSKKPVDGTRAHGNPAHVRTASQGVPSEQNLATLDSGQPARTSQSEALSDETPPPAAAPCSSGERKISPSASKAKITLSDWQAAPFFRAEGHFVLPDTRERVTDLAGWRAMVARHGGAPDHLLTPWAWRQAEHLAQHLAMQTTVVVIDALLDGIAYWVAEAAGRDVTIRSLALIGQPLYAALASGSGSRIFDRPSSLPKARYNEASLAAADFAQALSNCNVDVPSLTSTLRIEHLADMLAQYGREAVVRGINQTIASWKAVGPAGKPGPPEGETVYGWRFFEADIEAVARGEATEQHLQAGAGARYRDQQAQWDREEAEQEARRKRLRAQLRQLAPGLLDRLEAGGVKCKRDKMCSHHAIAALGGELEWLRVDETQVEAVMQRFCEEAIADRTPELAGWRKSIVQHALAPPSENVVQTWQRELQPAADAIIAALEAMGVFCDRTTLLTTRSMQDLNRRGSQLLSDAAGIQLVVEACREHAAGKEQVKRWSQIHRVFTMAQRAYRKLHKEAKA
jgi:hypothetical protein